jgi:lipopolysaccharide transport system permease protein
MVAPAMSQTNRTATVIRPRSGFAALDLAELWAYRDLLVLLAGRDVRLRYRQTALGIAWVILQPLLAALIFAAIFGRLAGMPSDGNPYLLFAFAGLLPWNFVSGTIQRSASSLIGESRLISKVYFPRLLIPFSSTGAVLIDFFVTLVVMAALLFAYGVRPTAQLLALPFLLLLAAAIASGIGLWVSALNVRYRDFMYAVPFLLQLWLYASPVAYSSSLVPERYRGLYRLNPAVGLIDGFRWSLLGRGALDWRALAVSVGVALVALISGAYVFRRVERGFADAL